MVELELAVAGPEGGSEGHGAGHIPCCPQKSLLCGHVLWVTWGYLSCFFSLVTAFEGSSPQVRGQLVLLWMVPWAGLEGEGREAVLTPPSTPRFLYSDEVQIGPETVMTTLYTAKKYAVPALEAHCVEFLKKNLRADNAFMLLTQVRGWDAGGEDVREGKAWDLLGHRC